MRPIPCPYHRAMVLMPDPHAYEQQFVVRWSDLDANRHLRNTAFSEYALDTRFQMLVTRGFPQARFEELRFGPVLFREDIRYRREVLGGQTITVNVLIAGVSADGSHWLIRQQVRGPDGKEAALLTIEGAWIHLDTRRLVAPPSELIDILTDLPRAPGYEELRSVLKG